VRDLVLIALFLLLITRKSKKNMAISRGLRNNNPGNLIDDGVSKWVGKIGVDISGKFHYLRFDTMENGIRAMAINAKNKIRNKGLDTLRKYITNYVSGENPTAYMNFASSRLGIGLDDKINVDRDLKKLIDAHIDFENGPNSILASDIEKGVSRA